MDEPQPWPDDAANGLPASESGFDRIQLAIAQSNPNVLYSVYSNVVFLGTPMQAFRTTNAGSTWTDLASVPDVCDGQCWYDMPITVSPTDPNSVLSAATPTIRISSRCSASQLVLPTARRSPRCITCQRTATRPSPNPTMAAPPGKTSASATSIPAASRRVPTTLHPDDHAIVFDPNHPNVMYTGTDGGLFYSTNDGKSWNNLNPGLGTLQFQGASISPNGQIFGGTQDNGTEMFTPQTGQTWNSVDGGDGGLTQIDPQHPNTIYHTYAGVNLVRSDDDGQTWNEIDFPFANDSGSFYPAFALAPSKPSTLYFGTYRIWRTDNKGGTGAASDWTAISPALEPSNCGFNCFTAVAVSPVNPNVVVVAGWRRQDLGEHERRLGQPNLD